MPENRPGAREKHVTGQGVGVHRRGQGLGTGGMQQPILRTTV
ncbi:MAG: hypothetical protein ACLVK6_06630 [Lachnospiraceae bacterium]